MELLLPDHPAGVLLDVDAAVLDDLEEVLVELQGRLLVVPGLLEQAVDVVLVALLDQGDALGRVPAEARENLTRLLDATGEPRPSSVGRSR